MNNLVYSSLESNYIYFDKKSNQKHVRKSVNGSIVGTGKCVGYCRYNGHPGFLTRKQRQQHDCIKKECCFYVKREKKKHSDKSKNGKWDSSLNIAFQKTS